MPIFPLPAANNPGRGPELSIAFTRGDETWNEQLYIPALLAGVLHEGGYEVTIEEGWLLPGNGLALLPQFLQFDLDEDGTAQTSTTIEIRALNGLFSSIFEYQHARSDESVKLSLITGFSRWMQVDLMVLEDAVKAKPEHCSMMQISFKEEDQVQPRRVLLGPVEHYAAVAAGEEEEHPFCPCCLFSNSMEGFMPLLKSNGIYAVRMYAARNRNGELMADCRVNGEDWDEGREALLGYIQQWPERGLEYRKQMIVIQPDL